MVGRWECTTSEDVASAEAVSRHTAFTAASYADSTPAATATVVGAKQEEVLRDMGSGPPVSNRSPGGGEGRMGAAEAGRAGRREAERTSPTPRVHPKRRKSPESNFIGRQPSVSTGPAPSASIDTTHQNVLDLPPPTNTGYGGTVPFPAADRGQKRSRADESQCESRRRTLRRTRSCEGMVEKKHSERAAAGEQPPSKQGQRGRTQIQVLL